ncbi:MAG: NADP-dependent phosphogluconate dehydrogenase, partial [Candidatus Humimicrobiaceae bacterium]
MREITLIGLGKMGSNMTLRLLEKGYRVNVYDQDKKAIQKFSQAALTLKGLKDIEKIDRPRVVWVMVPHQAASSLILEISEYLSEGDILIDGGNSFFKDSINLYHELKKKDINFLDVGVSGGPAGARNGACLMVGGELEIYERCKPLFKVLAKKNGYRYVGSSGSGHFVKMIHNAIEYGMMQSIAEGFSLMKHSSFDLDLKVIAELFNNGSVIESKLVGWLSEAYHQYGQNLKEVTGTVGHSGEVE